MVKIQLATGFLDVQEGTAFPLNFQVGDIRDISQRKGNFSKTITLVGSKNNNNLLNHYYDVNIVEGTFNINALTTCSVIQDGIPVMEDCSMQLTGVVKSQVTDGYEEQVTYEVLIKDSKADFFTVITNKELTDIDFADFDHTYNAVNVISKFTNTVANGYKYFLPASGDNNYNINEFKPAIFAKTYLDRIFEDAGFTYNWPSLSYDRFDKLFIPYNGEIDNLDYQDYLVEANRIGFATPSIGAAAGRTEIKQSSAVTITGWNEIEDIQNLYNPLTGTYTVPIAAAPNNATYYEYTIKIQYTVQVQNPFYGTVYSQYISGPGAALPLFRPALIVKKNGSLMSDTPLYVNPSPQAGSHGSYFYGPLTLPNGNTNIFTGNVIVTIPASSVVIGDLLTLSISCAMFPMQSNTFGSTKWVQSLGGALTAGSTLPMKITVNDIELKILPSSNTIVLGGNIQVNDYVPKKIKQSDFVKGILNMYNLYADVDSSQPNKLNLIHRDAFYDSGAEVDWTDKLAKDQEQTLSFLPELTSKKLILTYAEDDDSPNQIYTNATSNIYGQAEVIFDNEYVKDVDTKPILFGPTPVIRTPFNAYVPMIAGAAPQTNLRILYDGGMAPCSAYNIYDIQYPGINIGQTNLVSYPISGHFDNPTSPTFDINFAVCDFYYYNLLSPTNNNLYNRYWRRTMGQINNGKMLTAMFNLKEPDIQRLKLNDKIRIDNSWWNINKVIDYDANANKLTRVELISIDSEINFNPFINSSGPGVGLPALSGMAQAGMSTVLNTRSLYQNVITNGTTANVVGRNNTVGNELRVVVATDGAVIDGNGIWVDDLHVLNTINGRVIDPVPYSYLANLTQSGVLDPIAQVKTDSLGGVTWTRTGVGTYEGYLDNYEPSGISSTNVPTIMINNVNFDGVISAQYSTSSNTVSVTTTQIGVGFVDGYLDGTTIEIKYYI
jgi:hypothetical protein